jgi:alkylated DNA nucleotide flippase Atl1
MPAVKDRYRGTTQYFHVLAELVRAAQYRGVTTYQNIALIMGLPLSGSHMGQAVGHILGEISEDEVSAGRPMLSSVAVGVNGKAGPGFYLLAQDLGRLGKKEDQAAFWRHERDATYDAWRRPLPPSK